MSDNHSNARPHRVREIFPEDYDHDVLDYQSGLRRQAERAEQEANQPPGSRHDIIVIHLGDLSTAPTEPEPSTSTLPESQSSRSGFGSLTRVLKRMVSKKTKPTVEDAPTETQYDKELLIAILRGDNDAVLRADDRTLAMVLKMVEKEERRRRRFGVLAPDAICEALKRDFDEGPTGSHGNKEESEVLKEDLEPQPTPPKSGEVSENDSSSVYSQNNTFVRHPEVEADPDSPIDPDN